MRLDWSPHEMSQWPLCIEPSDQKTNKQKTNRICKGACWRVYGCVDHAKRIAVSGYVKARVFRSHDL